MVSIDVSTLDSDLKDSCVTFIESKLPVKSERDGDMVSFEDKSSRSHVSSPEIRTYMKRFLYQNDLKKKFRILSEDGSLTFVRQKLDEEEEEKEEKEEKEKETTKKKSDSSTSKEKDDE